MNLKKSTITGTLCLSFLFSAATAFAGPNKAMETYRNDVVKTAESLKAQAKSGALKTDQVLKMTVVSGLPFSASEKQIIADKIAKGDTNLIDAVYAAEAARMLAERAEFKEFPESVRSSLILASSTGKGKAKATPFTSEEIVVLEKAIAKEAELTVEQIQWKPVERGTTSKIMTLALKKFLAGEGTAAECYGKAIMEINKKSAKEAVKEAEDVVNCAKA